MAGLALRRPDLPPLAKGFAYRQPPVQIPSLPLRRIDEFAREIWQEGLEDLWQSTDWSTEGYGENSPVPTESLQKSALHFVQRLGTVSFETFARSIPYPTFVPAADGSIDLHWGDGENRELLLGFRVAGNVASFFGRDTMEGTQIKGVLRTTDRNEFLVAWLLA